MSILVELPIPPDTLNPNARVSWRKKCRDSHFAFEIAFAEARKVMIRTWASRIERAVVSATFYHATRRKRDGDNAIASLKWSIDGCVRAGLLAGDDAEHLVIASPTFRFDSRKPRVELLFSAVAPIEAIA